MADADLGLHCHHETLRIITAGPTTLVILTLSYMKHLFVKLQKLPTAYTLPQYHQDT